MSSFKTIISFFAFLAVVISTSGDTLPSTFETTTQNDTDTESLQTQEEPISNRFLFESLQLQLQNLQKRNNAEFYAIQQKINGVGLGEKCAIDYHEENGTEILSLTGNLKSQHEWELGTIRCYWSLNMNTTSTNLRLYFAENNLGPDTRLTISGFTDEGEIEEIVIDFTSGMIYDFQTEVVNVQIALTFLNTFPGASNPFFKLAFVPNGELTDKSQLVTTESFVTSPFDLSYEGQGHYQNNMRAFTTIYPEDRNFIKLTLTFLDVEECRNGEKGDFVKIFLAHDFGTHIEYFLYGNHEDNYRYCGHVGKMSEVIGTSTSAIVFFRTDESVSGGGFSIIGEPE